jgi:hypothetical protein
MLEGHRVLVFSFPGVLINLSTASGHKLSCGICPVIPLAFSTKLLNHLPKK